MVDITAIGTAVSGLKAAIDIAVGFKDMAVETEAKVRTVELMNAILSAQASALQAQEVQQALLKRIDTLEAELMRMKAWDDESQRYELADAGQGVLAYRIKAEVQPSEPPHWLCPNCYGEKKKSLLQPENRFPGRTQWLVCTRCHTELLIKGVRDMNTQASRPALRRR